MHTIVPIEELFALVGISGYVTVGQETVDDLAEVTGDRQWLHCDPDRAADSLFGGTIAHGHLTLALAPALLDQVLPLDGYAMAVNYGLDKLRFPAPLPAGERVRMRVALDAIPGGCALSLMLTFEPAAGGKPVCVANVAMTTTIDRSDGRGRQYQQGGTGARGGGAWCAGSARSSRRPTASRSPAAISG